MCSAVIFCTVHVLSSIRFRNPQCSELTFTVTTVLPPIPTAHLTPADVEDLTRQTRDAMLDALVRLTNSPRGQHAANPALKPLTTPAPPFLSLEEALADGKGNSAGVKTSAREDGVDQLRRHEHGKEM